MMRTNGSVLLLSQKIASMSNYYQSTLDALADISGYTDVEILGGRSEECADLRSIFVSLLMRRYANYEIARMTGLSRQ